jgi:leucyl aminopeptidase
MDLPMLELSTHSPIDHPTEALIVPVFEQKPRTGFATLDKLIDNILDLKEFSGSDGQMVTLYHRRETAAERLVFVGLGKPGEVNVEKVRNAAGRLVKQAMQMKLSTIAFWMPTGPVDSLDSGRFLEGLLEGAFLANHVFAAYKQEAETRPLEKIQVLVPENTAAAHQKRLEDVIRRCRAAIQAREWVNLPANDKKPADFADQIRQTALQAGLQATVLDSEQLAQHQFGALLAVGAGSACGPRLVILENRPRNAVRTVALIGKGVTFDSGGLNIKTSKTLNMMKIDMAGAAAVAGTLLAVADKPTDTRVVGILPLVENMVSGTATRPGDIIRTYSGKTVEVGNTDAEGRLILADAISYAIKTYAPEVVIDIATLTGACAIALGERIAAVFSPQDDLAQTIVQAGDECFERCWRMPLPEDYREYMKSDLADLNNMSSSRFGGAITAALFLSAFVEAGTRWAHIDIAGPAYHKNGNAYHSGGGTGFGVRLLCRVLETLV